MKSKIYKALSAVIAFSMLLQGTVFSVNAEDIQHYYGDIDNDQKITVIDLALLKREASHAENLTPEQFTTADLNQDGAVNVQDVQLLQDYLLKRISGFPVGISFTETSEPAKIYQDGVYTAQAYGYDGDVYVTVTIENDVITSITATSDESDEWYFEQACDEVIKRIINAQSPSVDVVSGATYSSQGIMTAVKKALNSAKI